MTVLSLVETDAVKQLTLLLSSFTHFAIQYVMKKVYKNETSKIINCYEVHRK